jgi:hypothetical protein
MCLWTQVSSQFQLSIFLYVDVKAHIISRLESNGRRPDSDTGDTLFMTPVIYAVNPWEIIVAHHT